MKKELEILLERLDGFENPKINLEQYVTPPNLAAFIVTTAKLFNDLDTVLDLGCGTGILSIASSLLGAYSIGIDIDRNAVKIARKNCKNIGVKVDFVISDVSAIKVKKLVTTLMNPPFGIQREHADRPFLKKALEISNVIYTIHSAGSEGFVREISRDYGFRVTHVWKYLVPLKRTYSFHERAFKQIPVEVFRIKRVFRQT